MSRKSDDAVLMSYRLPTGWQVLLHVLRAVAIALAVSPVFLVVASRTPFRDLAFPIIGAVIALILAMWLLSDVSRTALSFACTRRGIMIALPPGRRISIPWSSVKSLRQGRFSSVIVDAIGTRFRLLLLPTEVIESLIAITREASDARITGFTTESQ